LGKSAFSLLVAELPSFCTFISNRPHFLLLACFVVFAFVFIAIGAKNSPFEAYFTASTRVVCLFACFVRPSDILAGRIVWRAWSSSVLYLFGRGVLGLHVPWRVEWEYGRGLPCVVVLSCLVEGNVVCR
jgi:hypothetical protein